MNKGLKIALGAAGVAAVSAGVSYYVTKLLADMALDREKPKVLRNFGSVIAGGGIDPEIMRSIDEAAQRLLDRPRKDIEITSHDGIKLVGHYVEHPEAERVIVAMHGWRSKWERDYCFSSEFWWDNKCSVLYAEQRGQNSSGGDHMGFGLTERYDTLDWANYINENTEDLPIYLAGLSMGATTVLMAASLDLPVRVKGIMADCGFTSVHDIWKHVAQDNLHISYEIRRGLADRIAREKLGVDDVSFSTVDALRESKVPVLFIHGAADNFVPVQMTYDNYLACRTEKRLLIVPGADHGMSYLVEKEKYQDAVKSFWADFDK